jgi:hypothetical protein
VKKGKTPVLNVEETRELLDAIETDTVMGLRDRALIALIVYTFARVGAGVKGSILCLKASCAQCHPDSNLLRAQAYRMRTNRIQAYPIQQMIAVARGRYVHFLYLQRLRRNTRTT